MYACLCVFLLTVILFCACFPDPPVKPSPSPDSMVWIVTILAFVQGDQWDMKSDVVQLQIFRTGSTGRYAAILQAEMATGTSSSFISTQLRALVWFYSAKGEKCSDGFATGSVLINNQNLNTVGVYHGNKLLTTVIILSELD